MPLAYMREQGAYLADSVSLAMLTYGQHVPIWYAPAANLSEHWNGQVLGQAHSDAFTVGRNT